MVTINQSSGTMTKEGFLPTMHLHKMQVLNDSGPFAKDEILIAFIAKYDNKRYAVMTANYTDRTRYKVYTESDLHLTFNESL